MGGVGLVYVRSVLVGVAMLVAGAWVPTVGAADYNVTRTDDPAPDTCLSSDCSLREAVLASEASGGPDRIILPAGTFTLTRAATVAEPEVVGVAQSARVGDLDITDVVTISGAGSGSTFVDAGDVDRAFDLNSTGCAPSTPCVWISGLTVQNGTARPGFFSHSHGGGIHNHGRVLLTNVAVSGSASATGWGGGGITNAPGAQGLFQNVTLAGNTSPSRGGGLENTGTAQLFSVTIGGNTAPAGMGGGLFSGGTTQATNTIVAANAGGDCSGAIASNGPNLSGDASCSFTAAGDLPSTDPLFDPVSNAAGFVWIYALRPASPAVDAGTSTNCPTADQRGVTRPQDGNGDGTAVCDIGAYEFVPSADLQLTKSDSPDPVAQDGTLVYTITVKNNGPIPAQNAVVTDTLPGSVTFVSASPGCDETAGVVTCDLGSFASGETKAVTIVVTPTQLGAISNSASVSSPTADPELSNNADTESTTVKIGCLGVVATIVSAGLIEGTAGPDVIVGSAGPDVISSLAGADVICALGGNDFVVSGLDGDRVDAGTGLDLVYANGGNDVVWGGFGSDLLFGGAGADFLDGDSPQGIEPPGRNNRDLCDGGLGADTTVNCEAGGLFTGGGGDDD